MDVRKNTDLETRRTNELTKIRKKTMDKEEGQKDQWNN